jgi:CVNH domain
MFNHILYKYFLGTGLLAIAGLALFWLLQSNANAADCASGSFGGSCNEIKCVGETLHAKCKNIAGARASASLDNYLNCSTDIANCNGQLRCLCDGNCPSGSYSQTCTCCSTGVKYNPQKEQSEKYLYCMCKNKKGKYIDTSLADYQACKTTTAYIRYGMITARSNAINSEPDTGFAQPDPC